MWSILLAAAILLAQVQPALAERWCFERGQQGAKLCENTEDACNKLLQINPEIATGPCDIHALGVRHIVNLGLHTHEKALSDEAASVSRLGMTYLHP